MGNQHTDTHSQINKNKSSKKKTCSMKLEHFMSHSLTEVSVFHNISELKLKTGVKSPQKTITGLRAAL